MRDSSARLRSTSEGMGRLLLILLVGVGAYLLPPRGQPWRWPDAVAPARAAQEEPAAVGPCPTNRGYPGRTDVVVLPHRTGGYGGLQYARTPLPPRTIALTFDDGPDWRGDPRVFDILEERCLTATFFHVGMWARMHPELVREAIARGHGVASHSWSHPTQLRYWRAANARHEVDRGFEALYAAASEPKKLLLVDGGSHNNSMRVGSEEYRRALNDFFGLGKKARRAVARGFRSSPSH